MSSTSAGPREEVRVPRFRHHAPLTWRNSQVVIALGSNQGDKAELLRAAARALPRAGVDVAAYSSLYETAPAYVTDQARSGRCAAVIRPRADGCALADSHLSSTLLCGPRRFSHRTSCCASSKALRPSWGETLAGRRVPHWRVLTAQASASADAAWLASPALRTSPY